jgi:hypothetical protein
MIEHGMAHLLIMPMADYTPTKSGFSLTPGDILARHNKSMIRRSVRWGQLWLHITDFCAISILSKKS